MPLRAACSNSPAAWLLGSSRELQRRAYPLLAFLQLGISPLYGWDRRKYAATNGRSVSSWCATAVHQPALVMDGGLAAVTHAHTPAYMPISRAAPLSILLRCGALCGQHTRDVVDRMAGRRSTFLLSWFWRLRWTCGRRYRAAAPAAALLRFTAKRQQGGIRGGRVLDILLLRDNGSRGGFCSAGRRDAGGTAGSHCRAVVVTAGAYAFLFSAAPPTPHYLAPCGSMVEGVRRALPWRARTHVECGCMLR